MKILIGSDFHGSLLETAGLPDFDLALFPGDLCPNISHHWINDWGFQENWIKDYFNPWLDSIHAKHKIVLGGNHDGISTKPQFANIIHADVLHDRGIRYMDYNIYGSPWVFAPEELYPPRWAFGTTNHGTLKHVFDLIPDDTNILMTHNPPYGIMDEGFGSRDLLDKINTLSDLQLHCFGHAHKVTGHIKIHNLNIVNSACKLTIVDI